jgi:M6 family metalloprotease-like protein
MLAEGVSLAEDRQTAFRALIEADPQRAVASALSSRTLRALPAQVTDKLERRLSGIGDYELVCLFPEKGQKEAEPLHRIVHLNGATYAAQVYGRRLLQGTRLGIPLHGVVVDGVMAVDADVLRELSAGESPDPAQQVIDLRQLSGGTGSGQGVMAEAGGKVFRFSSREQLRQAEALLEAAEEGVAPGAQDPLWAVLQQSLGYKVLARAKAQAKTAVAGATPLSVRVLLIRVDFSDLPGEPFSAATVQDAMDTAIAPYYLRSSYGKVTLVSTVTPQVYRMPQPAAAYAMDYYAEQLHGDATTAAGQDYDFSNFDRLVVVFTSLTSLPGSQINWGGRADIGGDRVWVNGEVDFRVLAHELGHTFGLYHAGLWETADGNPISDIGTYYDYCDMFDTMGANWGDDSRTDFNPYDKRLMNWIDDTQIETVAVSGTYRIHRIDGPTAVGALALKVAKDSSRYYWIGLRHNFGENTSMMHGAYIFWGYDSPYFTYLINTVDPGGTGRYAALPIGRALVDPEANLTITPVAEGGEPPDEYLDVQVDFGPPPIISAQSTAQTINGGQSATFTVQASGSPPPAFQWECRPTGATCWIPVSDNGTYSGSHSASLSVLANNPVLNGYQFRCILTNADGGFNCTQPSTLTVVSIVPHLQIARTGDGITLTWPVTAGKYILEASSEPDGPEWLALTHGITVSGNNYMLTLEADLAKAFFRLRQ